MHPDFGLLVDYFRGELDASQAQSLRERLETDANLFAEWDRLKRTYAVIRSLPAPAPRAGSADTAVENPVAELPLTEPRPAYVAQLRREFTARGWTDLLPWLEPAAPWLRALRTEFSVRALLQRLPLLQPRAAFVAALRTEFGVRAKAARLPAMNVRPGFAHALRAEFAVRAITASLPLLEPSERFKRRLKVALFEAARQNAPVAELALSAPAMPGLEPSDPFRRRLFAALGRAGRVILRPSRSASWQPRGRELVQRIKRSKGVAFTAAAHALAVIIAFFLTPVLTTSQAPFVADVAGQYHALPPTNVMPQPVRSWERPGNTAFGPVPELSALDDPAYADPSLTGLEFPPPPLGVRPAEPPRGTPPGRPDHFERTGAVNDAQAWFRLRTQPRERKIEYLGSPELYEALDRCFGYLRRMQEADGGWGFKDVHAAMIPADNDLRDIRRVELTAAAVLAFLGDGHSSKQSAVGYDYNVVRGVRYLLSRQQPDGRIGPKRQEVVLCHAMATLALLEDYALTGDSTLRGPLRDACRWLAQSRAVDARGGQTGAFPYRRGQSASLMTSAWSYMALATARNVRVPEVDAPRSRLEELMIWFAAESRSGAALEDQWDALNGDLLPTAAAATLTGFAGDEGFELRRTGYLDRVARETVDLAPRPDRMRATADMRYAFFGSLSRALGGGAGTWEDTLGKAILRHQARDGANEGSFENTGYYADLYGRVFSTAFAALSIENAYRVSLLRNR